jgi:hemerythrin superfamily protein
MNAISMLESDHRKVETLFTQFRGEGDLLRRRGLAEQIVTELAVHAEIEEAHFYPAAAEATPGARGLVDDGRREHTVVKRLLADLERLDPEDAAWMRAMDELEGCVRHHVEEEEGEMFPKVGEALGSARLEAIGQAMEDMKKASAPRV